MSGRTKLSVSEERLEGITRGPLPASRKVYRTGHAAPRGPGARPGDRPLAPRGPPGRRAGWRRPTPRPGLRHQRPVHRPGGAHRPAPGAGAGPDVAGSRPGAGDAARGHLGVRPRARGGPAAAGLRLAARAAAAGGPARRQRHPAALRAEGHRHPGDGVRGAAREPRGRAGRRGSAPRAVVRGEPPADDHAGVRARRGGARPGHHPGQRQPPGARADDHRPELPGEDQRQHRQLGGHLLHRGGGGEAGVVHPLGRGHGDGPVHRAEHPRDARVDPPQQPGAHRHGAHLPGAGEGGRQGRGADLGDLPGHAGRAGRAGRGLLHHPRRRAAPVRPADGEAGDRHRQPRRKHPRQVVPRRTTRRTSSTRTSRRSARS